MTFPGGAAATPAEALEFLAPMLLVCGAFCVVFGVVWIVAGFWHEREIEAPMVAEFERIRKAHEKQREAFQNSFGNSGGPIPYEDRPDAD